MRFIIHTVASSPLLLLCSLSWTILCSFSHTTLCVCLHNQILNSRKFICGILKRVRSLFRDIIKINRTSSSTLLTEWKNNHFFFLSKERTFVNEFGSIYNFPQKLIEYFRLFALDKRMKKISNEKLTNCMSICLSIVRPTDRNLFTSGPKFCFIACIDIIFFFLYWLHTQ